MERAAHEEMVIDKLTQELSVWKYWAVEMMDLYLCGLKKEASCHILRHTFATRLCESGVNLKVIQDILGHVDISTTMNIYVDAMDEMKQKEIAKYITKPEEVDNMTIQDLNRITMMKMGFVNP